MNHTLWAIFEYVITVIDALIVMRFVCVFFNHDFSGKKGAAVYLLGSALFSAAVMILNSITIYEGLLGMLYIVVIFLFSLAFLKGNPFVKLFIAVGANLVLVTTSAIGSGIITGITGQGQEILFSEGSAYRFLMIATVQLLRIYLFEIILRFMRKGSVRLKPSEWALILLVFAISASLFALAHSVQIQTPLPETQTFSLTVVEVGLALINVVCFAMVIRLSKSHAIEYENKLLKQQIEFRERYAENTRIQEQELRTIRHDMKNSVSVIETLLSEGKTEQARAYLRQLREEKLTTEVHLFTENEFVNAIVSTRFCYAASVGIHTFCSSVSKFPGISDIDLCNLLGNLLDNAIEACAKCSGEKVVELKIVKQDEKIIITVVNTICGSILEENPNLKTSKFSKKIHGYGIPSVKSIAEKYSGSVDFYEEDGSFHSQVILIEPELCKKA